MMRLKFIFVILFVQFVGTYSYSQLGEFNAIRISRVSHIKSQSGTMGQQIKIDLETNKVYYRKKASRKFKQFETRLDITLFTDSMNIFEIQAISKMVDKEHGGCRFHNEYGYYKVELLNLNRNDEVYGESFLINNPYECEFEDDRVMVREYYELIIALFKEN